MSIVAAFAIASSASLALENAGEPVSRILVVHQDDPTLNASIETARGLARGFGPTEGRQLEIYTEFLDSVRFPAADHLQRLADVMSAKYEAIPLTVVVAVGPSALRFILKHRHQIAPGAPLVFGDVSERTLETLFVPDDAWGVISPFDVSKTIDLAIRLQPDANSIVVAAGSAEFDRYWQENARQKLHDKYRNLPVRYLAGQTLDGFLAETRKLTPQTILLILTVFEDVTGRKFRPRDVASQIAAASGAPAYGLLGSYVGSGIVGGEMATFQSIGEDIAAAALRVMAGNETAPHVVYARSQPTIDWRQLGRWNINTDLLPEDVNLLFYGPTAWERYRWQIIIAGAVVLAQTLAIMGLMIERHRRRAAEQQSRSRLLELVHLNQSATAGALSASIAHELNQPLGAIRANAEAAETILQSDAPDLGLIRQILADIRDDDQRAGDIVLRLRGLLKKRSEIDWQQFDLNEVIKNAVHILHAEAERRSILITASQVSRDLPVRADRVHVQQVILNLATNAMDAIVESDRKEKRVVVLETALADVSKVEVSVSDTGHGIPSDRLGGVFEPFYTTKPNGMGLGLSISRAIIETYGGRIWAENRRGSGAVFRIVLPLAEP